MDATVIIRLVLSFTVVLGLDSWPVVFVLWMLPYYKCTSISGHFDGHGGVPVAGVTRSALSDAA